MEIQCGYCNKRTLGLRRCSACKEVYYCSQVCQRGDWKGQHKVKCKELQKSKETQHKYTSNNIPFVPKKENRSGSLQYQSEPAHGVPHKDFLESMRQAGNRRHVLYDRCAGRFHTYIDAKVENDRSPFKICTVCGELSAAVKTCSRCKSRDYCSKECQKKDREKHKPYCKAEKGFASPMSGVASPLVPEEPDLSLQRYAEPGAMDKAKSLAWKTFPGCTILDFIREIPPELRGMRPRGTNKVVVGFISRFHQNILRHCIFLQDKDGDELYVAFYVENDDPSPYFRWENVVPGRYICIEDPYIHPFMDGSVGIRVDFSSTVRVFTI